jgi:hypothetical protein
LRPYILGILLALVLPAFTRIAVAEGSAALQHRGQHAAAEQLLRGWLYVDPTERSTKVLLSESLRTSGDLDGSLQLLR